MCVSRGGKHSEERRILVEATQSQCWRSRFPIRHQTTGQAVSFCALMPRPSLPLRKGQRVPKSGGQSATPEDAGSSNTGGGWFRTCLEQRSP